MFMFVDETHLTPEETLRRRGVSKRGRPPHIGSTTRVFLDAQELLVYR